LLSRLIPPVIPRLILDTNALSAAAEEHPGIAEVLAGVEQLMLPVVVIGEYRYGIARSRDSSKNRQWLDDLVMDSSLLDVTEQTTHHYAAVRLELKRIGKPIPVNDLWIAALCRQHGLPLLSRDRHFDVVAGIQRFDW
jgi:tRNA(fMet)-specific endonuclease VapC